LEKTEVPFIAEGIPQLYTNKEKEIEPNLSNKNQLKPKGSLFYLEYGAIA
jgi:hypothetical protein